jgi:hypothetical protein
MASGWLKNLTSTFSRAAQEPWERDRDDFFKAIRRNNITEIKRIHAKYPNEALDWKTEQGSPLQVAHTKGRLEAFKTLVGLGMDINAAYAAKKGSGRTPLLHAINKGQKDFISYILDNGGDVNKSESVMEALHFMYFGTSFTPVSVAIEKGDESILKLLLAKGADPSAPCYGINMNKAAPLSMPPAAYAEHKKKFKMADIIKRAILQQARAVPVQPAQTPDPATANPVGVMQPLKLKKSAPAGSATQ